MDPHLLDILRDQPSFLLVGHRGPDGDCLGSMVALRRLLTSLGHRAVIALDAPPPPELGFLDGVERCRVVEGPELPASAVTILVDCGDLGRTGGLQEALEARTEPLLVIDHHAGSGPLPAGREVLTLVDPAAAATALLVTDIYRALGLKPDPEAAEALLTGVLTDTFWLQNSNADARALATMAWLVGECAPRSSTARIYDRVFRSYPAGVHTLLATTLQRCERHGDRGRLLVTALAARDIEAAGLPTLETEFLLRPLMAVGEVEVVALLYELAPGRVKFSLRSRGGGEALALARALGGGGHREAAGASREGNLEGARALLLDAWEQIR